MIFLSVFLFSMIARAETGPTTFPVFLRQGFSCVLEFDSAPKRIVVGDLQSFQVEKMDRSLVVRSLTAYATSNMFVYFDAGDPRLFVLTASEDAEPTLYRKFESPKLTENKLTPSRVNTRTAFEGARLISAKFDAKKDYLTVDAELSAGNKSALRPEWELIRLTFDNTKISPVKSWSERKEIQRDSKVKVRFIFAKPNVPKNLSALKIIIPLNGQESPILLNLGGK